MSSAELILAVRRGDADTVERLLAAGADPNARDDRGERALYWAIDTGGIGFAISDARTRILDALLAAGADPTLDDVGARLCKAAWACVTSGLEANYAHHLAVRLGLRP